MSLILPREFFERPAPSVAPDLLGCVLVRILDGQRLVGLISETEAYQGEEDQACHARVGETPRTKTMYGPPGHAYIYFTYGMHWLLNAVTDRPGSPSAVLIRAVIPLEGAATMQKFRPRLAYHKDWLNGPAKLTQAFGLNGTLNGVDLCSDRSPVFITGRISVPREAVLISSRVGIQSVPEPWRSIQWRWQIDPGMVELLVKEAR